MKSNQLAQHFQRLNLPIPTEQPPEDAIIVENPMNVKDFECNQSADFKKSEIDKEYERTRSNLLSKEDVAHKKEQIAHDYNLILETLINGNEEQIYALQKQRHQWRQEINQNSNYKICEIENCINYAIPGFNYCASHITLDQTQKIYKTCEKCKNPYIPAVGCLVCRK